MYCRNCGKEINDNLIQCPYCNTSIVSGEIDNGSIWWGVLGCCTPMVGLVLYVIWRESKPQSAKKAGIGALLGFLFGMVIPFLLYSIAAFVTINAIY